MSAIEPCRVCDGEQWVCENHRDRPWGGLSSRPDACECGAGSPCGACDLERAGMGYAYRAAEAERAAIVAYLRGHAAGLRSSGSIPFGDAVSQLAFHIERLDHRNEHLKGREG